MGHAPTQSVAPLWLAKRPVGQGAHVVAGLASASCVPGAHNAQAAVPTGAKVPLRVQFGLVHGTLEVPAGGVVAIRSRRKNFKEMPNRCATLPLLAPTASRAPLPTLARGGLDVVSHRIGCSH